ncbi:MAG: division/cell wall cluster transcriptional repressor MraZ [Candidatus Shapirobacteria bacterium]
MVKKGGFCMFLGSYEPNLISKGRLALPKKIRSELPGERLVLTLGFEKCIYGFAEKEWEKIVAPELARPLFSDAEGRDLRRQMCMEAMVVELGSQGRLVMPEVMVKYAGAEKQVVIVGAGDHFEIWEKRNWEKYRNEKLSRTGVAQRSNREFAG